jgi:hypothetical protein
MVPDKERGKKKKKHTDIGKKIKLLGRKCWCDFLV